MKNPNKTALIPPGSRVHETELSALASLTSRRLRQMAEAGKIPLPVAGTYPAAETINKLITQARLVGDELRLARLGKTRAEETLLRMQIEETAQRLVPLEWVETVLRRLLIELREGILNSGMPDQAKQDLLKNFQDIPTDRFLEGLKPQPWMLEENAE